MISRVERSESTRRNSFWFLTRTLRHTHWKRLIGIRVGAVPLSVLATIVLSNTSTSTRAAGPSPPVSTSPWPISRCTHQRACHAVEIELSSSHRRVVLVSASEEKFALSVQRLPRRRRGGAVETMRKRDIPATRARSSPTTPDALLYSPRPRRERARARARAFPRTSTRMYVRK